MNLAISEDAKHRNEKLVISGNCHCPPSFRYSRLSMIRQTSRKYASAWEQRKLGDVTDSFSGGTPDVSHTSYYGGSIPFIRSAEINSDKTELFLTEKGLDNSSAKIVERGTVLYALYGATSGEVGIAAIKGAINQAILALSPHTGNDPLFLASWLRREKARIVDTYLQGGQGNLSGSIVKELSFALPQQKEQQVIGSFFSRLDNLITLHQRKRLWFAK